MDTPRKTKLYRELAKDFTPKQAAMMICKYIEELESRIAALEAAGSTAQETEATAQETKRSTRKPKQEIDTE